MRDQINVVSMFVPYVDAKTLIHCILSRTFDSRYRWERIFETMMVIRYEQLVSYAIGENTVPL